MLYCSTPYFPYAPYHSRVPLGHFDRGKAEWRNLLNQYPPKAVSNKLLKRLLNTTEPIVSQNRIVQKIHRKIIIDIPGYAE